MEILDDLPLSSLLNTASTHGIAATALPCALNVARLSDIISPEIIHLFPSCTITTVSLSHSSFIAFNPLHIDS